MVVAKVLTRPTSLTQGKARYVLLHACVLRPLQEASLPDLYDSGLRIVESADSLAGPSGHETLQVQAAGLRRAHRKEGTKEIRPCRVYLSDICTSTLTDVG